MTNISNNTPVLSNIANETASVNKQEPAKKYEFVDDGEYIDGYFLTRIRALRDFDDAYPEFGSEDDYYRHEYYADCEWYYDDDNDSEYENDAA
ncbi:MULTISPECIES: hypothetical protein [unclassified Bartonella]|uniref:hypothetical protein n=1 Tax=unclassified Bartonella TaxID=2645622 RepID=UPI0035D11E6C